MKIGFIGGYGHHYLRAALGAGMEAAVASDGYDAAAAKRFADLVGIKKWYDYPPAMLDDFRPDAVSIGAVYGHNGDLAAMTLAQDIPTVSDKPIAATWEQLAELRRLANQRPRILLTEFDFRSKREFRSARQIVEDGRIGKTILVTAQKSYRWGTRPKWYAQRSSYGGTLLWIASHGIDAVQWITGQKIVRVCGHQGNLSRPDYGTMEDHLAVLMELDNGATAVVHADFLRPAAAATHGDDRIRIAGSGGLVEVRGERCLLITQDQAETDLTNLADVRQLHIELLAGLQGQSQWFSTEISLSVAEVLLHARDAADGEKWISIGQHG
jgi:predicted dehydrogenase